MRDSYLFSKGRSRRTTVVRLAIVMSASASGLGCSDSVPTRISPPRAAPVLRTVEVSPSSDKNSIRVGERLSISVRPTDQYGAGILVDSLVERTSDTTIATVMFLPPAQPWDYDSENVVIGARPGDVQLTVTATLNGISRSASRSIMVLP